MSMLSGQRENNEMLSGQQDSLSLGKRLRQAREAQGLDLATTAAQLHLKRAMVEALEKEDFAALPARVFVRGYYRNYARLVGLPEAVVLDEFERRCPEGGDCVEPPPVLADSVRKEIRSNHGLVRLATWVIVAALIGSVAWWWKTNSARQQAAVAEEPEVVEAAEETPAPAVPDYQPPAEAPESAPQLVAAPELPAATPETEATEPAPAAVQATVEPLQPPVEPKTVLRFSADCWVDIRGSNRSFKVVGKRKAGDEIVLDGQPPYRMVLGNASAVEMLVNGKRFDLTPFTKGNVAKLTFDPSEE